MRPLSLFLLLRVTRQRARKKILSFGFLFKKVSIHPLKKKTLFIQQRGLRLPDDDDEEEDKEEDKEDKEENIIRVVVDALRFVLGRRRRRRLFLGRRSGRVHVFGELTRIFCWCVRETSSFIHSFAAQI